MSKQKIIDRSVIEFLIANKHLHNEFPELRGVLARGSKTTACCGRNTVNKIPAANVRMVKLALMGLPSSRLDRLKEILKADVLVFHMPNTSGRKSVEK